MATIDLTQPVVIRKKTGDEKPPTMTRDQQLRARGYRIVSRPTNGEPVWERDKKQWRQSQLIGA